MLRIGIQGGRGSFDEEALVVAPAQEGVAQYETVYCSTTERVLRALSYGSVERGIFAIHNVQSRLVDETVAVLGHYPFDVMRVVTLPIRHCLMMRRGMMFSDATVIMGHEEALAQCRKTLQDKCAHVSRRSSGSGALKDGAGVAQPERADDAQENVERLTHEIKECYGITVKFEDDAVLIDAAVQELAGKFVASAKSDFDHLAQAVDGDERILTPLRSRLRSRGGIEDMTLQEQRKIEDELSEKIRATEKVERRGISLDASQKAEVLETLYACLQYYPDDLVKTVAHDELDIIFSGNRKPRKEKHFGKISKGEDENAHAMDNVGGMSSGAADRARIDIILGRGVAKRQSSRRHPKTHQKMTESIEHVFFVPMTFHHEFFHRMDELLRSTDRGVDMPPFSDEWEREHYALGGALYKYDKAYPSGGTQGFYKSPYTDFLEGENLYARANPLEDRAQIAGGLMDDYPGIYEASGRRSCIGGESAGGQRPPMEPLRRRNRRRLLGGFARTGVQRAGNRCAESATLHVEAAGESD